MLKKARLAIASKRGRAGSVGGLGKAGKPVKNAFSVLYGHPSYSKDDFHWVKGRTGVFYNESAINSRRWDDYSKGRPGTREAG